MLSNSIYTMHVNVLWVDAHLFSTVHKNPDIYWNIFVHNVKVDDDLIQQVHS